MAFDMALIPGVQSFARQHSIVLGHASSCERGGQTNQSVMHRPQRAPARARSHVRNNVYQDGDCEEGLTKRRRRRLQKVQGVSVT